MARVIDYAWGRPSIAALKGAGAIAVCRYLAYLPNGKCLSRSEADGLRRGGIDVVSNWEQDGNWTEFSGGFSKGVAHAQEAARQHVACGGPPDRPIYFSSDWDVTSGQMGAVTEYFRGVASVIGLNRTGAYGGYRLIQHLFDAGVIKWGWQAYAWSGGRWDPRAQLRQTHNGVRIGGVDCDLDDSTTADFGQWGAYVAPPKDTHSQIEEDNDVQLTPATKNADGTYSPPTPQIFMFPFAGQGHGVVSLGCDFGSAKVRVAAHNPSNNAWAVDEVTISSSDQRRLDVTFDFEADRVSVVRRPIDPTDTMQVPVGILTWF